MKLVKLVLVTEAAKLLRVNPSSIRQLERRGLLAAVRDWNGHRRFRDSDISRLQKSLCKREKVARKGVSACQRMNKLWARF